MEVQDDTDMNNQADYLKSKESCNEEIDEEPCLIQCRKPQTDILQSLFGEVCTFKCFDLYYLF